MIGRSSVKGGRLSGLVLALVPVLVVEGVRVGSDTEGSITGVVAAVLPMLVWLSYDSFLVRLGTLLWLDLHLFSPPLDMRSVGALSAVDHAV